jgi:1-acyl-sn-glycerol-3-phosphate acyltransferase
MRNPVRKALKKTLLKIYLAWAVAAFCVIMTVSLPLVTVPFVLGERLGGRIAYFFLKLWGHGFGLTSFIRFRAVGRERIRPGQPYIYVANHNSYLDSPAFVTAIPGQCRPLGKAEMRKIPVFGWLYPYVVVVVDRSSVASRIRSMNALKDKLKQGISVFIFPEGSMNTTDQPLLPFYDGAFRLAVESQTPIMPMVILNSRRLLPRTKFELRPGTITTVFLEPVPVTGLTLRDIPELKEKVYQRMKDAYETASPNPSRPVGTGFRRRGQPPSPALPPKVEGGFSPLPMGEGPGVGLPPPSGGGWVGAIVLGKKRLKRLKSIL